MSSVLIVGGGVTGLLTGIGLAAAGVDVTVAEAGRPGDGQSGACHGYLHRGYAYGPNEAGLSGLLRTAHGYWRPLVDGFSPVTSSSTVLFGTHEAARTSVRRWRGEDLAVSAVTRPGWAGPASRYCYATPEPTYDMARLVARLTATALGRGLRLVTGAHVSRLVPVGRRTAVDAVATSGVDLSGPWDVVVLAAGDGSRDLLDDGPVSPVNRAAYMLVLRGRLPPVSAVFPERDRHGLFIASRRDGTDPWATWLVSTFHSFDAASVSSSDDLFDWWVRAVLRCLRAVLSGDTFAGIETVAGYRTLKSGLRPERGTVAGNGCAVVPDRNLVITVPSKLTLAPVVAERGVREALSMLGRRPSPDRRFLWDALTAAPLSAKDGGCGHRGTERWAQTRPHAFDARAFATSRDRLPFPI
jgi:glycine/D-amino acid oxidase-like deaminating enzyme